MPGAHKRRRMVRRLFLVLQSHRSVTLGLMLVVISVPHLSRS